MHAVLLGIDLLRMHNNKPYFKDSKHAAGFLKILDAEDPRQTASKIARQLLQQQPTAPVTHRTNDELLAQASIVASATVAMAYFEADAAEATVTFSELHDLSDGGTYALAALIATLLLQNRMGEEHVPSLAEVRVKPAPERQQQQPVTPEGAIDAPADGVHGQPASGVTKVWNKTWTGAT
jgi:hypothetical protein